MTNCYEEFRGSLLSYTKYELFNKPVEVDGKNIECEELSSKLRMHKSFKKFCYMLSKNIEDVCKNFQDNQNSHDNCEFLNYWLYDALIRIKFINNGENISESSIMDKISELWDESKYNKKCNLTVYNINTTDFMRMKALYDYSKNYLAIETNKKWDPEEQCRNQYCSYIKKVDHVYKIAKSACNPKKDKAYCQILSIIPETKIPSVFLTDYKCTDADMNDDFIKYEKIFTNPLLASSFNVPDYPIAEQEMDKSFSHSPQASTEHSSEGSSSNSSVKVGLSTFGMSLVPLFLIYKFTPGGNFLRRVINQKIGTNYNTGEIPSGDWFSISRAHQNDIQANREFNVLYQNMENK
ncbi:Plasmodium vivax Vir protein, putative [Plasmodium vivax]|uniref:Vir protein, putative n=1 Tax=Plasmodium vivax TaxID=5855 RepID=A0A1G4E782_PLAVI|nr:Plasmodium vivax Vir protein, putative [Plasmodium vivax]